MQITIYGESSQKSMAVDLDDPLDLDLTLLLFLQKHNFPIASSCRGEGICKLCKVNEKTLSCSITVRGFIEKFGNKICISYL